MEDADENIIISPIEFDLGAYQLDSLAIPLDCNSVLKCKEEYIIKFSFADIDAENPPCIKTYDSGGLGETLYINNAKVSDKIVIAYNYEEYYQIEQFVCSDAWNGNLQFRI